MKISLELRFWIAVVALLFLAVLGLALTAPIDGVG